MAGTRRDGTPVDLHATLAARDERSTRRAACLLQGGKPTITLSLVIPGAVKDCALSRAIAEIARSQTVACLARHGWAHQILFSDNLPTGPESLYQVDYDAITLKRALVALEDSHPLGRLWDLDIHTADGQPLSRRDVGEPPRRCLVCDENARSCGRSRRHSLDDLWAAIEALYDQWLAQQGNG